MRKLALKNINGNKRKCLHQPVSLHHLLPNIRRLFGRPRHHFAPSHPMVPSMRYDLLEEDFAAAFWQQPKCIPSIAFRDITAGWTEEEEFALTVLCAELQRHLSSLQEQRVSLLLSALLCKTFSHIHTHKDRKNPKSQPAHILRILCRGEGVNKKLTVGPRTTSLSDPI